MTPTSPYSLLAKVSTPEQLRELDAADLDDLAVEMRRYLIETIGRIGGHFAANLGTVELSIALHRVLNTPHDRLVWDVGHQAYPHKMLTGRRAELETIRKFGGLAPFPSRFESDYDAFGAGHSSTSISAALGMAIAAKAQSKNRRCAAVIGDGGMTAGMAFEALNHLGVIAADVVVIFNDNDMSISENVGALREHSSRILEKVGIPQSTIESAFARPGTRAESSLAPDPGSVFEAMGVHYSGPIDGHDFHALIPALEDAIAAGGPQLLHIITVKGKGFEPAEKLPITYHGVTQFDPVTGDFPKKETTATKTYTGVFSDWLVDAGHHDERVVGITPAMREGSGLVEFSKTFPERYFDVAIAEQHAVTVAGGMAADGLKPVVAIYSSFLQRGYDQLIHDVALQDLPVVFALDRGGLVGADGATHHGAFDLSFMRCIPNMVVMTPSDERECRLMLNTGLGLSSPSAIRYPRGAGTGVDAGNDFKTISIGKAVVRRQAKGRRKPRVAILAFGAMVPPSLQAAEILDADVVDMRFVKPIDEAMILDMANRNDLIVTVEDNVIMGGAGSAVNEVLLTQQDMVRTLNLGLPDRFVEHGTREELLAECGLDADGILRAIQVRLRSKDLDSSLDGNQANLSLSS